MTSDNRSGALWMLASVVCFTAEVTLIKTAGASFSPVTILFWRQAVAVALLAPFVLRRPRAVLSTPKPGLVAFRSLVGIAGILLAIAAFSALPLADATTLSFTRVLWIVLIAALVMREPVGLVRLAAVLVGFAGVVILLRPGAQSLSFDGPQLMALGAALLAALSILSVKQLSRDHSVLTLTTYAAGLGLLLSAPFALLHWQTPSLTELLVLLGVGIAGLGTLVCYTRGMQLGDASVMAPIDYLRLVLAAAVGLIVFGEPLTPWLLAGAALIVPSAILLAIWRPLRA